MVGEKASKEAKEMTINKTLKWRRDVGKYERHSKLTGFKT